MEAPRTAQSQGRRSTGAFDPRLLEYTTSTRRFLVAAVALGVVTAGLVALQAWMLATVVSGAFVRHQSLGELAPALVLLLVAVGGRALVVWSTELASNRASTTAKSELRRALTHHVAKVTEASRTEVDGSRITVLAVTGVDALDAYFSRYLPQLLLAVIVPVAVLAIVCWNDWISAAIIAVTLPLVPVFMALVGATTRDQTRERHLELTRLGGHFLDIVSGLPTLKVFGRAKAQAAAIADATQRYRRASMATLRLSFLSSLILELVATISVALVAVAVGLRLLGGHLDFRTALFVLVLAPEAYLPLRQLGTHFHASADGMRAAEAIFEVLDVQPAPRGSLLAVPDLRTSTISIASLGVVYPGRPPALRDFNLRIDPGTVVALVGPSGCGKSTLLEVLCGLVLPTSGSVEVGDTDLAELEPGAWRSKLAWVPQHPHLFATSIAENLRLGRPDATDGQLAAAVRDAHLEDMLARLPEGIETRLGERGAGLSRGERQRVALARAFVRDAPLLLLDEPTAGLDGRTEEAVVDAVRSLVTGRTVVVATHRPALLSLADRVVGMEPAVAR
ncbi:MAG: thiol reductant ABC exporter subunit CydD [Acidimicrobiales bacterium]